MTILSIVFSCMLCSFGASAQASWKINYNVDLREAMGISSFIPDATGIVYFNGYLYVSIGDILQTSGNALGKIYKLQKSGSNWSYVEDFTVSGVESGNMNFTGLTTDGTYIYAVNRTNMIYKINMTTKTVMSSVKTNLNQALTIAYNPDQDNFFVVDNNNNAVVQIISKDGTTINGKYLEALDNDGMRVSVSGLSYDNEISGGPYLLASCGNNATAAIAAISRWNLNTLAFQFQLKNVGSDATAAYMGGCNLYFDKTSGKHILAAIGKSGGYVALIGYEYASLTKPAAPERVSNLVGTHGASGALTASLTWTNPTKTVEGNNLSSISSIKIYRNETVIATLSSGLATGAAGSYTDNNATAGMNSYKVVAVNGEGNGRGNVVKVFVGPDVPAAVTNPTLTATGSTAKLNWVAPTKGLNGGWFDNSSLRYSITRLPDSVVVQANGSGLSFTETAPKTGIYAYLITSKNAKGEGGTIMSNYSLVGNSFAVPFVENFNDVPHFKLWTVINSNDDDQMWTRTNSNGHKTPSAVELIFNKEKNSDDWLISPPIHLESGKKYVVKWSEKSRSKNFVEKYEVRMGNAASVAGQTTLLLTDTVKRDTYLERSIMLNNVTTSGTYYFSWHCISEKDKSGLYFDDISVEEVPATDLIAVSLSGPVDLSVGQACTHKMKVRNNGYLPVTNFDVALFDNEGNSMTTKTFTGNLNYDTLIDVSLTWTPTTKGNYPVKAIVNISGDANSNNDSSSFDVRVQPYGTFRITVGENVATEPNTPFYFQFEQSVSQTLYFADELNNNSGVISEITYYNSFNSGVTRPVRIFMENTNNTEFYSNVDGKRLWITKATLVYEGNVTFPAGSNSITLTLDKPFVYTGGNLMLMTFAPTSSEKSSTSLFHQGGSDKEHRALYRYTAGISDIFEYIKDSTEFAFNHVFGIENLTTSNFPKTSFVINTEVGAVSGVVKSGNDAVVGATVSVEGSYVTAITDKDGKYSLVGVPTGSQTIKAAKVGYKIKTETLTVSKAGSHTQDFALEPIQKVVVDGKIVNASSEGVGNASIMLSGYANYQTVTDASGNYTFADVFEEEEYTIAVRAEGFKYHEEALIPSGNTTVSDIQLDACSTAEGISNLNVVLHEDGWYKVKLTWSAPANKSEYKGYYVFVNGLLQNENLDTLTSYSFDLAEGNYTVAVSAVKTDDLCESTRTEATVEMEKDPCETAVTNFPYIENYESGKISNCWIQDLIVGKNAWTVIDSTGSSSISAHSGARYLRLLNKQQRTENRLTSPIFDISALESPTLDFWHMQPLVGTAAYDQLNVYYKNSIDGEWVKLKEFTAAVNEWTQQTFDLPHPSDYYQIALEGVIRYNDGVYLDDIRVINDLCDTVTNIRIEQKSETTALLSWTAPTATRITGYTIKRNGNVVANNIKDTSFLDSDIALGANNYEVIVNYNKAYCQKSAAAKASITMVEKCDPLTVINMYATRENNVNLSWAHTKATKFKSYTLSRDGVVIQASLTDTVYVDKNLSEGIHEYCVVVNYQSTKPCTASSKYCQEIMVKCTEVDDFKVEITHGRVARLSWDVKIASYSGAVDFASFNIYKNNSLLGTTRTTSFSDRDITVGRTYNYCIEAVYDNGCTGEKACVSITIPCEEPENVLITRKSYTDTDCTMEISWSNAPALSREDLQSYEIDRKQIEGMFAPSSPAVKMELGSTKTTSNFAENAVAAKDAKAEKILYDNGPYITFKGTGYEGNDVNAGNAGFRANRSTNPLTAIADDFRLNSEATINSMDFFVYVPGYTFYDTTSILSDAYIVIYDGKPGSGGRVIWGDMSVNRMIGSTFANAFVVALNIEEMDEAFSRPIFRVSVEVGTTLPAGEYWVEVSFYGYGYNLGGPWMSPIAIDGELPEGNALHYAFGVYSPANDGTGFVDFPFVVYGEEITRPCNVYRDDDLIASNVNATKYLDKNVPKGTHTWTVERNCNGLLSEQVSKTVECSNTKIVDGVQTKHFSVYPNPTSGKISVAAKDGQILKNINIFNVYGQLMQRISNLNNEIVEIDLSLLSNGIYFLDVDGERLKVIKN